MKKFIAQIAICIFIANINAQGPGNSLNFDGVDDYVILTNQNALKLQTPNFSIELWVQPTTNNVQNIIYTGACGLACPEWVLSIGSGDNCWIPNENNKKFMFMVQGTSLVQSGTVVAGQWYHVAVTYDGTNLRMYINGILDATTALAAPPSPFSVCFMGIDPKGFGCSNHRNPFAGNLDELRVWNTARSASEIMANKDKALTGNETGLTAYFNFDQGTACGNNTGITTLNDITASASNGTLANFALTTCVSNFNTSSIYYVAPGNALNFDGINDYVVLPNSLTSTLNGGTEITIEYWFKGSNLQSPVRFQDGGNYIIAGWGTTNPQHIISTDGGTTGISVGNEAIIEDGKWHHLAMTWKANTENGFCAYLDGILVDSRNSANVTLPTISTGNFLGTYSGAGEWLNGTLDEVRIWNVAQSQATIRANMYSEISAQTGLVAYYRFNQGIICESNTPTTTLIDLSGNNSDGTLTNFALSTGCTSNWVESYAMVVPVPLAATDVTATSFTANWSAPSVGTVTNYLLDVSTTSDFSSFVWCYNGKNCGTNLSQSVTGLTSNGVTYYYRVRADKTSVTGQGGLFRDKMQATTINLDAPVAYNATNVDLTDFTANWNYTIGASSYSLEVSEDNFATQISNSPFTISSYLKSISTFNSFTIGLKEDSSVVCWGSNSNGQCNVPAPNTNFISVSAGSYHAVGLKADGTVVCWGENIMGQLNVPEPNSNFIAVDAGQFHSIGLKADGSVVCWGYNTKGQCNVPVPNSNFIAVSAGGEHSIGLKQDGSIVCWGRNDELQCSLPVANTGFIAISAGMNFSIGLRQDGSIVLWGSNSNGQCDAPNPNSNFIAIVAGGYHYIGLKSDGSLFCCGSNFNNESDAPVPNSNFVSIAAGNYNSIGLKADGSLVCWGKNHLGQSTPPSPNNGFKTSVLGIPHSLKISNLDEGTTYKYRLKSTNCNGQSNYSNEILVTTKKRQTITFSPFVTPVIYGVTTTFNLTATAGSGLPVTFSSSDPSVATISGNLVTVVGGGDVNIIARQAGNDFFIAAPDVVQTLSVRLTPPGNALNFNGTNNYVTLPNTLTAPLSGGTEITIEYWFKGSNLQSPVRFQDGGNYIIAGWGTTNPQHIISTDGGTTGISVGNEAIIEDGKWHHLAMTWKANTENGFCAYLDGILVACKNSANVTLPIITNGNYLGTSPAASEWLSGTLDEVRIWSVAHSQEIIRANMYSEISAQSGLVTYYKFNQGLICGNNTQNKTLVDFSGNNYAGTLSGFTLTTGCTSNWVESYAMVVPVPQPATNITDTSFTANWTAPEIGTVTNYYLDVSEKSDFSSFVYQNINCGTDLSYEVTSVSTNTKPYYYRVRANKASVSDDGVFYRDTIVVATKTIQTITNFNAIPDKAVGDIFTVSATGGASLNPVTFSSDNTSVATVSGNTVTVVGSGSANIIASQAGNAYYYAAPDVMQTLSVNLTAPGNALSFNGTNNYVALPNALTTPLISGTEITIEYWFKGNNLQSPVRFQDGGNYIIAGFGTTNPQHIISTDGGTNGISAGNEAIIEDGKWHHLAMTWKANTVNGFCAYLDGNLVASKNSANVTLPAITKGNLLGTLTGGGQWLAGTLDEVRIWSVAQTQATIRANMYSEVSAQTGLIAYYKFNQGTACGNNTSIATLNDFSGNNYNGTLTNFILTTGCTSNWVESYAMVVPVPQAATNITDTGFTANWTIPALGTVTNYYLDVSEKSDFSSFVFQNIDCGNTTSFEVTSVSTNTKPYYYRVRADKTSVTGQGVFYYNCIEVITKTIQTVSFTPFTTPVIYGVTSTFNLTATASSGLPVTFSSDNPSVATISGNTVTVVGAGTANITANQAGNGTYYAANATLLLTVNKTEQTISNFNAISDKAVGAIFAVSATASSGLPVTFSSDNTLVATVSGNTVSLVGSGVANIIASQAGNAYYYAAPDVMRTLSVNLTAPGNALNFSGTYSYVPLSNDITATLNGGTEITIEYWFKGSNLQSAVRFQDGGNYIIAGWGPYNPQHIISTDGGTNGISIGNEAIIENGQWHHIAMTWKANTVNGFCAYLDGNLVASKNTSNVTLPVIAYNKCLGTTVLNEWPTGSLDEVRIWNIAQSQAAIRANMYSEISAQTGLVAYYKFNQGAACGNNTSTTTLYDFSGNNYNGILANFGLTTGCSSNWVESYAMAVPLPQAATNITATSFTANWTAPAVGIVSNYYIDVSEKSDFSSFVLQNVDCGNALSFEVTSVSPNTKAYYYRVRANKLNLAWEGGFHYNTIKVATKTEQSITGFDPISYKEVGDIFTVSATASSGLPVTYSSDNLSVATVSGNTVTVVGVGVANITASQAGDEFYYAAPDVKQLLSVNSTSPGNALNFNGTNNSVALPNAITNPLSGGNEITIEYWFKGSNLQSAVRFQDGVNYFIAGWGTTNPKYCISTDGGTNYGISIGNEAIIENGQWHHLAMTWKSNTVNGFCAYLDGILVDSRNSANVKLPIILSGNFLGAHAGTSNWLAGTIDEVRIWKTARTQQNIRDYMYAEYTGNMTDLVAYYKFNQGITCGNNTSITTLFDISGNNYNGTLNNFSLTSGCTANWVESYAMVVPVPQAATNLTAASFTANWTAPATGTVTNYYLDVSETSDFSSFVLQNVDCGTALFYEVTSVSLNTRPYYYRVRANKTSVTGEGNFHYNYIKVTNRTEQTIADFNAIPDKAVGDVFTVSATASSGLPVSFSSDNLSVATVSGNTVTVVGSGRANIIASQEGNEYFYAAPDVMQTLSVNLTPPGNALNFNGTDNFVTLPNTLTAPLSGGTEITIEYWFKGSNLQSVVRFQDGGNYIIAGWGTTNPQHIISTDGGITGISAGNEAIIENGKWHHIAMTWKANTVNGFCAYLDGNLVACKNSANVTLPIITKGNNLGTVSGGGEWLAGTLDEVRIWSVAHSQEIIRANMYSEITSQTGLVAYYKFNQGVACGNNTRTKTLYDFSGNNYNGTLSGFVLTTGCSSNWVESYAMVVPTATAASNITGTSFTANWTASVIGISEKYLLDVSTESDFSSFVSNYHNYDCGSSLSANITGLTPVTTYYYRVRSEKASVSGQGIYSNTISETTFAVYNILASVNPENTGTISGAGNYYHGQTINLIATPETGFHFVNWTENGTSVSTLATYTFTASENRTLVANFTINTFTLTYMAGANGTISGTANQTVNYNSNGSEVTAVPNTGYHFVNWSDGSTQNPRTDLNVMANISVTANFAINTFTLTYIAGANGTISGTATQTVNYNSNGSDVTAVPNTGYHFINWSDGSTQNPRTDLNVMANISVTANFAINTFTLTYIAGANGTISGTATQTVNYNSNGSDVTAVPNTGYHFVNWSDGSTQNPRTDLNVMANISVTANFAINTFTLTYIAGANGTISGTATQTVNYNSNGSEVTAVPNTGYHFINWSDGSTQNPRTDLNVMANISVTANFAINTFTLSYMAGANGTIMGETSQVVNYNSNGSEVTAVPDSGYHFVNWSDGSTQNPRTDLNVMANISVTAIFAINNAVVDIDNQKTITIYPNPTESILNFSYNRNIELISIKIYNMFGQNILVFSNIKTNKIDVSTLENGVYFVEFIIGNAKTIIKMEKR